MKTETRRTLMGVGAIGLALLLGMAYGVAFLRYEVFPYQLVQDFRARGEPTHGPWSIGIYEGDTPLDLAPAEGVDNPVLTALDVTDTDAVFVADPFMITEGGRHHMFFEVLDRATNKGDIAYAVSDDGRSWDYQRIVLDEEFHLSYPYVFEWEGEYWMVPETFEDSSVRLYRATSFPEEWEYVGNLLSGYRYTDASLVRHEDRWWLFVTTTANDVLNVYHADELTGPWQPHAMNPVVKDDLDQARPGGRMLQYDGRLFRLTQDDYPSYGLQVYAREILELTPSSYVERPVRDEAIVAGSGSGWNGAGMHHIDAHLVDGRWLAMVDGRSW